jgi:transposase InsO family protein
MPKKIDPAVKERALRPWSWLSQAGGLSPMCGPAGRSSAARCSSPKPSTRPGRRWTDRREVEWQVARWVHWYNTDRLHSSIGHLPPIEFEHHHRQARTETPNREVA